MTPANFDVSAMKVVERIPAWLRPHDNPNFPNDMIAATILRIGMPEDSELFEGGGLVIDYKPIGESRAKRIVLAFNESGMWVTGQVDLLTDANQA